MRGRTAIVIGAGPAGAAAAFRLHEAGWQVQWIERGDEAGGRIRTRHIGGYIVDIGAGLLPGSYAALLRLIRDSGQGDQLERRGCPVAIALDGKLHRLDPAKPLAMLATPLLNTRSKVALLRLLRDLAHWRSALRFDSLADAAGLDRQTLADYAQSRLTPEIYEYLLNPVQKSLYAIDGREASCVDALWSLKNLLGPTTYNLRGGMDRIIRGITEKVSLQLRTTALEVCERSQGVEVTVRVAGGETRVLCAAACIIATPAREVPLLYPALPDAQRRYLAALRYSCLTDLHLRLRKPLPDGVLSVMVPNASVPDLAGLIVDHAKGSDRAPSGKGLLTVYFMHHWSQRAANWDDETIYRQGIAKVERVLPGITSAVDGWDVARWDYVATMSHRGHYHQLAEFSAQLDTNGPIQLAGDYFSLASMNSAVCSGEIAVQRLLRRAA